MRVTRRLLTGLEPHSRQGHTEVATRMVSEKSAHPDSPASLIYRESGSARRHYLYERTRAHQRTSALGVGQNMGRPQILEIWQVRLQHSPTLSLSPLEREYHVPSSSLSWKVSPGGAAGLHGRRRKYPSLASSTPRAYHPESSICMPPQNMEKAMVFKVASSFRFVWLLLRIVYGIAG